MTSNSDLTRIQSCLLNRLDHERVGRKSLAGIIGDAPSHYAKSPSIWNSAFQALGIEALYLPFDVERSRLSTLVHSLKESPRFMGANVTVPHKVTIIEYLDGLDETARKIGAVNTVVRTQEGLLTGCNTDGTGFSESLLNPLPGEPGPFLQSLKGIDALIIGAGGSARAVAFRLAEDLRNGQLFICNRTEEAARSLAAEVSRVFPRVKAIREEELSDAAQTVGLIVNCSTKGQGGTRKSRDGKITLLEPYSALAPAHPAIRTDSGSDEAEFYRDWLTESLADIEANNHASWKLALSIPARVAFCDLIYFPAETVFLRHGRLSGHRTLNGKGMNIAQAAQAFHSICRAELERLKMYDQGTYKRVFNIMYEAW